MKAKLLVAIAIHPNTYRLGKSEAHDSCGMTYGTPDSLRSIAYDMGRTKGESSDRIRH